MKKQGQTQGSFDTGHRCVRQGQSFSTQIKTIHTNLALDAQHVPGLSPYGAIELGIVCVPHPDSSLLNRDDSKHPSHS